MDKKVGRPINRCSNINKLNIYTDFNNYNNNIRINVDYD